MAATCPSCLRDGDVLILDPAAERVWDPLAGVPPSLTHAVATSAAFLAWGRPIAGLGLFFGFSRVAALSLTPDLDGATRTAGQGPSQDCPPTPASRLQGPSPAYAQSCLSADLRCSQNPCGVAPWVEPGWQPLGSACLAFLGLGGGPSRNTWFFLSWSLLISARFSVGTRVDSPAVAHRLWQPGGGLQDPVWSRDARCRPPLLINSRSGIDRSSSGLLCMGVVGNGFRAPLTLLMPPLFLLPRPCPGLRCCLGYAQLIFCLVHSNRRRRRLLRLRPLPLPGVAPDGRPLQLSIPS